MRKLLSAVAVASASLFVSVPSHANLVGSWNFESAPSTQSLSAPYGGWRTADTGAPVQAQFRCGLTQQLSGDCFVFDYGGTTRAFDTRDTPQGWTSGSPGTLGAQGLTDEPFGPLLPLNFYFNFSQTIYDLGMEVIDFREAIGSQTLVLDLYSGNSGSGSLVGTTSYTLSGTPADGAVISLFASAYSGALSAVLRSAGTLDPGLAIDNVRVDVPEPGMMGLLGLGTAALLLGRRRQRRA